MHERVMQTAQEKATDKHQNRKTRLAVNQIGDEIAFIGASRSALTESRMYPSKALNDFKPYKDGETRNSR